jgi:putative nucleotidyltransferase with HDIG domain
MSLETIPRINEHVAALIKNIDAVITLPEVTARIVKIINDPNATAGDLHRIIAHDPSLVSRILQRVNSSFYERTTKIDSVERAIVLMGFGAVNALAISATMGQVFTRIRINEDFTARDLWTHSVAVAVAAREMAKQYNWPMAEEAFLAGLLHDIGLLVELQVCPDKLRKVCDLTKSGSTSFVEAEQELIGCTHADLAGALAQKWNFPDYCRAAMTYHHNPSHAEPADRPMAALIYAADTICCQNAMGFNLTAKNQLADIVALERLVPQEAIEHTKQNLPKLFADAMAVFGS